MSNRAWFYASAGQQQGPYSEGQFRDLIGRGMIRADTLVWTEGMANWQKAGDIPGMVPGAVGPAAVPQSSPVMAGGADDESGAVSADLPTWSLLGRSILYVIGIVLVIPAPWVATSFYRWLVSRLHVPGRPHLAFEGKPGDIWYVFVLMGLMGYANAGGSYYALIAIPLQAFLSWMALRWVLSHLSANGQPLPLAFNGDVWSFIGWQVLTYLAFFTIIGWAWVVTATIRWICRNIVGTRREILFTATGLDMLWRTILLGVACLFVIPIPWALRWYAQWYMSQFVLVERGIHANA